MRESLSRPLVLACKPQLPKKNAVISRRSYAASGSSQPPESLSWREYLAIRGSKRKWQVAATVPCALLGFIGGATYFGTMGADPTKTIMGIDPFFFYGISTVGCVGAVVGPSLGTALWRMTHRNKVSLIDAKDREFYKRIAKNRVDATLQSPTSPIPDYYGEKIGSIHGYRQWLRDQSKYRRKVVLAEE
ncbi:hypothetical protein AGABI2DRAFT_64919 [Agaricus bisporus var. bisporus H97]|uniref:hypothetical protein n=1 Tax=Agaricus bisporus var. bisporus (strain H97 / ATCC MYA-4626 / FGSC 10389) TaxID=936046 RepID=UPI00029F5B11|nr:hypothetical protein AGABI2DRAFT_64919 [Agaricus bisporus var. bisporus H97]EKV49777.1 hypothetical protein AGABI2DRAFT_64919 [Agaricus bisporus var. bisporus H97]